MRKKTFRNYVIESYIKALTNKTFPTPLEIPDDCYFITFTLQPQFYKMKAKRQLKKTVDNVESLLRVYSDQYWLVAELTKTCNIHYHAIVKFTTKFEYAMDKFIDAVKLSRSLGMCKVNPDVIIEKQRTIDYLIKDYKRTHSVVNAKMNVLTDVDIMYDWKRPPFSPRKPKTKSLNLDSDTANIIDETEDIMEYAEKCIALAPTALKCVGNACKFI